MLRRLETGLRMSGYEPGNRIVVALSGGPDSTALTLGLSELLTDRTTIAAAHFNHRARGEESDADEEFVRDLCERFGIPLSVGHAVEPSDGISENAARVLRYRFLQQAAVELDAPFVSVAHTADDQAETVLQRITRGTGVHGLAAMPYSRPIAEHSSISLIRPMLSITRAEVTDFLNDRGITPRHDSSNDDDRYARNRIRHHVLPALKEINPAVVQAITRLARIAREHNAFIDAEFRIVAQQLDLPNLNGIQDLPTPLAARLLEKVHAEVAEPGSQIEMNHIDAVLQLVKRDAVAELNLPGNVILRHRAGNTTLSRRADSGATRSPSIQEVKLPIPGSADLGNGTRMTADVVDVPDSFADAPRSGHQCAYLSDRLKIDGSVVVRGRAPGDRYAPFGSGQFRKVQDMMVNAKIPRHQRDNVPVVDSHLGGIVWIAGFPPSDSWRVEANDTKCVKLAFHEPADS